ncbi:MAG TPA: Ig-like domain-containing protein [Gemmatimonadaceae bacterium]|nr:Ig-like domain-containing protein [Gemmatimonadaceae bacterium]
MKRFRDTGTQLTVTVLATAALLACGGGDSSGPSRTAATLTANSPTSLTGTAGGAVGNPPSVVVKDQNGSPLAGAPVSFSVLTGGGLVSTPTVTTDANGVATVGTWTLGQTAGSNTLSASSGSATAITFTATGSAGPAATLTKVPAGDNQTTRAGFIVDVSPAVIVKDQYGNPVSGAIVNFAVASGGGFVSGGSTLSTANGTATVGGWRLGDTPGVNTLSASAPNVAPVTFTATGTPNPPCSVTSHALGSTSSGALTTADCNDEFGAYVDLYTVTVPTMGIYAFNETATFDTYLETFRPDQTLVGFNDDANQNTTNSQFKALLPAGDYVLGVTSWLENKTGAYTLSSAAVSTPVTNCEEVWVVKGVSTDQALQTTDCVFQQFFSDDYFIYLNQGQSITVSENSTAATVDAVLEIYDAFSGAKLATADDPLSNNAQITFTAPGESIYVISATSKVSQSTGGYTLIIQ